MPRLFCSANSRANAEVQLGEVLRSCPNLDWGPTQFPEDPGKKAQPLSCYTRVCTGAAMESN